MAAHIEVCYYCIYVNMNKLLIERVSFSHIMTQSMRIETSAVHREQLGAVRKQVEYQMNDLNDGVRESR
jgi:hypothetical protein